MASGRKKCETNYDPTLMSWAPHRRRMVQGQRGPQNRHHCSSSSRRAHHKGHPARRRLQAGRFRKNSKRSGPRWMLNSGSLWSAGDGPHLTAGRPPPNGIVATNTFTIRMHFGGISRTSLVIGLRMATEPKDGPSPFAVSGAFVSPVFAGAAPIFRRVSIVRSGLSALGDRISAQAAAIRAEGGTAQEGKPAEPP